MRMRRSPLVRKTPLKAKAPMRRKAADRPKPPATRRAKEARASKIRQSARDEGCLVRIPGVCCADPATVVLAHLNGGGVGMKAPDWQGAYACATCHAWLDGGYVRTHTRAERDLYHLEAVIRTQEKLIDKELLSIT